MHFEGPARPQNRGEDRKGLPPAQTQTTNRSRLKDLLSPRPPACVGGKSKEVSSSSFLRELAKTLQRSKKPLHRKIRRRRLEKIWLRKCVYFTTKESIFTYLFASAQKKGLPSPHLNSIFPEGRRAFFENTTSLPSALLPIRRPIPTPIRPIESAGS